MTQYCLNVRLNCVEACGGSLRSGTTRRGTPMSRDSLLSLRSRPPRRAPSAGNLIRQQKSLRNITSAPTARLAKHDEFRVGHRLTNSLGGFAVVDTPEQRKPPLGGTTRNTLLGPHSTGFARYGENARNDPSSFATNSELPSKAGGAQNSPFGAPYTMFFGDGFAGSVYVKRICPVELEIGSTDGPVPAATMPGTSVSAPSTLPGRDIFHCGCPVEGSSAASVPMQVDPWRQRRRRLKPSLRYEAQGPSIPPL